MKTTSYIVIGFAVLCMRHGCFKNMNYEVEKLSYLIIRCVFLIVRCLITRHHLVYSSF